MKNKNIRTAVHHLLALMVLAQTAAGQSASRTSAIHAATPATRVSSQGETAARRTGSIKGRLIGDSGQAIPNADVQVRRNSPPYTARQMLTDEDGRFHADDLTPGVYIVFANLVGYVAAVDSPDRKYYRIGDTVNIQLTKGGVITGRVTTHAGEPVVAARTLATRVRDSHGRPVRSGGGATAWTDDRGIYRMYGLQSGDYLVSINGGGGFYPGYAYEGDIPVYYPSSTRDAAREVSVQNGQEVTGIDIRYRSELGHAISGTFTGLAKPEPEGGSNNALLIDVASSSLLGGSNSSRENGRSFAFYGVSDGDYQIIGQSYGGGGDSASAPRRVTVKGADVTGIELAMAPLGSVTGRFILERLKKDESSPECKDRQRAFLEEATVLIRRDQRNDKERATAVFYGGSEGVLDEKGEFAISRLSAGRYNIDARLPGEGWFLRAVSLPGATPASTPLDIARDGMTLTVSQRITGLVITAAEGAAALRGKVIPASEDLSLPSNLRVHLVPAEPASADDALRFAETLVNNDGTFSLTNLAPGRYFIMARVIADDEWMERTPRPLSWDRAPRAKLRQASEAANAIVELRQCQGVTDYVIKYAAPRPKLPSKKTPKIRIQ